MNEINYLTADNAQFYKNNGGFIGLKHNDQDYKRVSVIKAFPFSYTNLLYSVRDVEGNEIGMIENFDDLSEEIKALIQEELDRRYFMPQVTKIKSIKDEFGYSYWNVVTNMGNKKFIIKRDNSSFINIKDNLILIVDVDGNRYEIPDYTKLDVKSLKLIDLLL